METNPPYLTESSLQNSFVQPFHEVDVSHPFQRINLRGMMLSSLPGFIAMALVLALSKIPGLTMLGEVLIL
jgi:hypothetical protein